MCFGCAHREALKKGDIPPDTTFDDYMKNYFWKDANPIPEGKTIEDVFEDVVKRLNSIWWVYIVECSDGTLYTGISNNVSKRISDHNEGKGAKYTRGRLPVALKWSKVCDNKSEASKLENKIKKMSKKEKLKLISNG